MLELPDNLCISPRKCSLLCEDGPVENFLRGVTPDGKIFDFARNAIAGRQQEEFAGSTFTPDGKVLFVNIQACQRPDVRDLGAVEARRALGTA